MRITIEDATIVTVNARDEVLAPGWMEIRDGAIAAVSTRPLDPRGADRRIDGRGKVTSGPATAQMEKCSDIREFSTLLC